MMPLAREAPHGGGRRGGCRLYTSDAADEAGRVDADGRVLSTYET